MAWLNELTWIDTVVLVVILASMILSLFRGLVKEIASLAVWVLAFVAASRLASELATVLPDWIPGALEQTVAFLGILVVVLIVGKLVTLALKEMISAVGLGAIDRILGMAFGAARGVLIVVALAILAAMTSLPSQATWRLSKTRPALEWGIKTAAPWLPNILGERIRVPQSWFKEQGDRVCVA
jgi:membrane protein required for colicin V production